MSNIETILTRAMSDAAFSDLLFADADKALAGYDLTAEELASLRSVSRLDFEKFSAAAPEERKSFGTAHLFAKFGIAHLFKKTPDKIESTQGESTK